MGRPLTPLVQGWSVVPTREADLDVILEIETASFDSPWPREAFEKELKNSWSTVELVVGAAGPAVGFIIYWIVHDELHLLNIAIRPAQRRKGLGRCLLAYLERVCEREGLTYITLEVRVSNRVAIDLYESVGFRVIHRRKRYYVDDQEDALVMAKVLG